MKILQRPLVMGGLAIAFVVGMATAAGAVPISLNAVVGPLPVPTGPVTVCVSPGPGCVTTPSATSVTLSTSVTSRGKSTIATRLAFSGSCVRIAFGGRNNAVVVCIHSCYFCLVSIEQALLEVSNSRLK